jgi:ABC-type transport system involved in multi-copper enzyme maturation permease subunit
MSERIHIGRTWLRQTFSLTSSRRAWLDRISLGGLALCCVALALLWARLSASALVVILIALAILTATLLRQGWIRLFGPILFYDLVTTARRSRFFFIRYLCLLTLVSLLFFVYWIVGMSGDKDSGPADAQRTTQVYFLVFVTVQSIFLVALAPAYVAGCIAEEKERGTLEFVLATDLQNREIIFGKLISRLANLFLIFMAGMPILSILQFLGGVDPVFMVTWAASTAVALVGLASLCMLSSVINRRPRDAIAMSYFFVFGYLILSGVSWMFKNPFWAPAWVNLDTLEKYLYVGSAGNPIAMAVLAGEQLEAGHPVDLLLTKYLRDFALFELSIALVCCIASVLLLRVCALRPTVARERTWLRIRWPRPRAFDHSLLWKEIFVEKGLHVNVLGRLLFCLLLAVSLAILWYMNLTPHLHGFAEVLRPWIQIVGMIGACLLLLTVGGRAATSMTSERDKATLDALLTCPVETDAILLSKWLGAVLSIRWGMLCLAFLYALGVYAEAIQWFTLPLMMLAWIVYSGVAAILGLWYSVTCQTSTSATVWTYLSTAGLAVGHWLDMLCMVPLFIAGTYEPLRYLVLMQAGFTPPYALSVCFFFGLPSSHDGIDQLTYGLEGIAVWLVIAVVLWLLTSSRFQLLTGRSALAARPVDPAASLEAAATEGGLAPATNG